MAADNIAELGGAFNRGAHSGYVMNLVAQAAVFVLGRMSDIDYRAPMIAWIRPVFAASVLVCAQVALAQPVTPTGEFAAPPGGEKPPAAKPEVSQPPAPAKGQSPPAQAGASSGEPTPALPQQKAVAPSSDPKVSEPWSANAGQAPASASASAIARLISQNTDWACTYESHALTERHVIVGCQEGSVLTLARTATGVQLIARRETDGRIDGFYEQNGAVWMRVVQENAERLVPGAILHSGRVDSAGENPSAPATASQPRSTPGGAAKKQSGTVTAVHDRDVVVTVPTGHGIEVGSRMSLSVVSDDGFITPDPVIARVDRVTDERVLLRLGVNEVVDVGYRARVTDDRPTASRRNPPRVHDVWELRALLRPMLNIGKVGGGVVGELGFAKRTEFFRFGVELAPLALAGATGQDTIFSGGGYVFGAVDHQVYSAGIGVGANTVNDTDFQSEPGSGLTIVQLLRIGAVDGLHVSSRVEAVIFRSEVLFSYLQVQGQAGVADGSWLIIRGGGGSMGYGFGEVVVRNLLWGTGQAGSTFMELGLGGAGLFRQACDDTPALVPAGTQFGCTEQDVGGPTFTAGLEWRL